MQTLVTIDQMTSRSTITVQRVVRFMEEYEHAQSKEDFDSVAPLIHPEALFRFNDGDYRGLSEIRRAFEATWALDVHDEAYRVIDVEVERIDTASAVVTFAWVWSGRGTEGPFEIRGRGTTVIVEQEGALRILIEHLSR